MGLVDEHTTVETAGAQQRYIQDVGTVGGRHHDDVGALFEAVHLREDLIERLLAFIVSTTETGTAALAPDGIYFIDEDDARCVSLCAGEQIAHARCADTHEHFHEFRTCDTEE